MRAGTLLHLIKSPRRTARGRGFGVHSPFAFRFVREALTQPWAYYAYPELDRAAREGGENRAAVRALFRTALFLRPATVTFVGCPGPGARRALELGNPCQSPEVKSPVKAFAAFSAEISAVTDMWDRAEAGMLFRAPEMAIFISWDNLPHQSYEIML